MTRGFTTESFSDKSRTVHGNIYDYSKVEYTSSKNKVTIVCNKHGDFKQIASVHLQGRGCRKCGVLKMSKTQSFDGNYFIERALEAHGDRYDYSKIKYEGALKKVTIICKEHGCFEQTASKHLSGQGCPKCGKIRTSKKLAKAEKLFIEQAIDVHKNRYDYRRVNYVNNITPVTIICEVHGKFEQIPTVHVNSKMGCPKCGEISSARKRSRTCESFITEALKVHKGKYLYEKAEYINGLSKVTITCPTHGNFEQGGEPHLRGQGCPKCGYLLMGFTRTAFTSRCIKSNNGLATLYIIRCYNDNEVFYKVGITSVGLKRRFRCKNEMPYKYEVIKELTLEPELAYDTENHLLRELVRYSYTPLIYFAGKTECFLELEPVLECLDIWLNDNNV